MCKPGTPFINTLYNGHSADNNKSYGWSGYSYCILVINKMFFQFMFHTVGKQNVLSVQYEKIVLSLILSFHGSS
jgi:K+-transporting ATPase A subunit